MLRSFQILLTCSLLVLFGAKSLYAQDRPAPLCSDAVNQALIESGATTADPAIAFCLKYLSEVDEPCQIELHKFLADLYELKQLPTEQLQNLQRAHGLSVKNRLHNESCLLLLKLYSFYMDTSNPTEAKKFLDSAGNFINKYLDPFENDVYLAKKADWFETQNLSDSAVQYLKRAISITEKRKDTTETHVLLHNLGNAYKKLANYEEAVIYFLQSIKYKEMVGDKINMPGTLLMMAGCYSSLGQYKTSWEYTVRAKDICKEIGHEDYLYTSYLQLAKEEFPSITEKLLYADSAILLARASGNKARLANSLSLKADIMFINKIRPEEAEKLSKEAIFMWRELKQNDNLCITLFSLGRAFGEQKKFTQAEPLLIESLELAVAGQKNDVLIRIHEMLSKLYEQKGDYKKGLHHYQQFFLYKDSVENSILKSNLAELERKYSIEKKESEINNLNREKDLQSASLKQAKSRQLFFVIFSALLLGFIAAGIWAYRKLRANRNELTRKNNQLDQVNQLKNRLFSIIAHDVKGLSIPFHRAARVLRHHVQKGNHDKTVEVANQLQTNAENLSNLLDNLLQWSLEQMHGYAPRPEKLKLKEEINSITEAYKPHAHDKNIKLLQEIPDFLTLETDKGAFHVVFRNLIANAIKYTENGSIEIKARSDNNKIMCTVADTGTGINPDLLEKLFSINEEKIRNGTAGEKGSGLGLVLVKRFLELNGGTIAIESTEGKGSVFTISLPLQKAA